MRERIIQSVSQDILRKAGVNPPALILKTVELIHYQRYRDLINPVSITSDNVSYVNLAR